MAPDNEKDNGLKRFIYPSWLFNLAVIQGAKERELSGYPSFYPIHEVLAASDAENYRIPVEQNEIWVIDALIHGDVLPDNIYLSMWVDDRPVVTRQLLREMLMEMRFPVPFPMVGDTFIRVENSSTTDTALYQAALWYRVFNRQTVEELLDLLGIELLHKKS